MFALVAFDQAWEFLFKGHCGTPGKGTATQRNWKGGRSVARRLLLLLPL